MPPTAPLAIATSVVQRLVREEASYHQELEEQTKRVAKLESETGVDEDGNREFLIKQEVCKKKNSFFFTVYFEGRVLTRESATSSG